MYQPNIPYEPSIEGHEITREMQGKARQYGITGPVIDHYFDNIHLRADSDSTLFKGDLEQTKLLRDYTTNPTRAASTPDQVNAAMIANILYQSSDS